MKIMKAIVPGALLALTVLGCQDLDTDNPNNPDTRSVQESPDDLESLIATSYLPIWNRVNMTNGGISTAALAGEFGGGFFCFGTLERGSEPRVPITTQPGSGFEGHFFVWRDWYRSIAAVNVGIRAIDDLDLVIRSGDEDVTPRTRAFAKFVQGVGLGWVALTFDQGWPLTEEIQLDTLTFTPANPEVQEFLRPYDQVMETAQASLDEATTIIDANNVMIPAESPERWLLGNSLSANEFRQLIYTYKAFFTASLPRSREEREAVDWNQVLSFLDQSLQRDFAVEGEPGVVVSNFQRIAARQRTNTPSDHIRPNYETLGVADQSGGFQEWWATPWSDRTPWAMDVDDHRIDDPNRTPIVSEAESEGLYLGHHIANVWAASRGTAHRSYYYWHRAGRGNSYQQGPILTFTEAEHDLLRAEALMWLGRPEEAVPLINKTRVANGGLAPVTVDGAPMDGDGRCTPRKFDGGCGSLWDALRWEKRVETMGLDGGWRAWFDRRGWQGLVEGTELHWPMPLEDQELMAMPFYTMGGGQGDSAPPNAVEQCPPAVSHLQGCP